MNHYSSIYSSQPPWPSPDTEPWIHHQNEAQLASANIPSTLQDSRELVGWNASGQRFFQPQVVVPSSTPGPDSPWNSPTSPTVDSKQHLNHFPTTLPHTQNYLKDAPDLSISPVSGTQYQPASQNHPPRHASTDFSDAQGPTHYNQNESQVSLLHVRCFRITHWLLTGHYARHLSLEPPESTTLSCRDACAVSELGYALQSMDQPSHDLH